MLGSKSAGMSHPGSDRVLETRILSWRECCRSNLAPVIAGTYPPIDFLHPASQQRELSISLCAASGHHLGPRTRGMAAAPLREPMLERPGTASGTEVPISDRNGAARTTTENQAAPRLQRHGRYIECVALLERTA